jgi:hypothetical protein
MSLMDYFRKKKTPEELAAEEAQKTNAMIPAQKTNMPSLGPQQITIPAPAQNIATTGLYAPQAPLPTFAPAPVAQAPKVDWSKVQGTQPVTSAPALIPAVTPAVKAPVAGLQGAQAKTNSWITGGEPAMQAALQKEAQWKNDQVARTNEWNAGANERSLTRSMTHEELARHMRQKDEDKNRIGLASATQSQQQVKMQNELLGKVLPAQANAQGGIDQEMVRRGLDPRTGQPLAGVNLPPVPVKDENGLWIDQNTGKAMPEAAQKRLDAGELAGKSIEAARATPPPAKASHWNPFSRDNVLGKDPKTGEIREFGSQKELDGFIKKKLYVALTPEEQKANEEGNKGNQSATGIAGAMAPTAPAASPVSQQGKATPESIRAEILGLKNAEQKKSMILAKLQDGTLTKAQAKALAIEHGLQ